MEQVVLKADVRELSGKKAAKDLRKKGLVPAIVYKGSSGSLKLMLAKDDITDALHTKAGENVLITLQISGEKKAKDKTVIIKEIQRHPVREEILHVDFNEISLTEVLKIKVPLVAHGEPVGVKKDGGTLEHVMWELEVECLPASIPERIEFEVSGLNIGDAVYVKEIAVPDGVKILNDPELITMIVKPPKVEVPAVEAVEEIAEPELIRKKKEEEEAEIDQTTAKEPEKQSKPKEDKKETK